ncbi:hypothetical protein AM588_10007619 [Phytophthora nicotianae]|uniref:Uncharacterized protein n=1 Tax=Phytophthora nicotianae TaxID=4792 RepID=A0A0W8DAP0_PHYNI|nr:hypothetical protein AM588_10007619 [Phytophthora nicotianae]
MEDDSGRLHLDHASLYDGPYGPIRAAMAYATSPLAMFYFFLPKELWRKIAEETNRYRLESIHEIAEDSESEDDSGSSSTDEEDPHLSDGELELVYDDCAEQEEVL